MQANQKLSFKDRLTSKLPGKRNQDKNNNGIPDRLEKRSDLNNNGIPDRLETSQDLNGNGIPDQLEARSFVQPSRDLNGTYVAPSQLVSELERSGPDARLGGSVGYTDLNRDGIPDQLQQGQGFGFVGSVQPSSATIVNVVEAPTLVERIEKPAVVHEVYKTEEVVQIQPVIEREREQLDVYEVVQPIREREVVATEVREAMLPAQTRGVIVEDNSAFLAQRSAPSDFSTRDVAPTVSQTVTNAPIVHETIVHKVIEEVQPVIYKEVDRPILVKETLPIYEKVVEAPHAHHTVLPVRDMGVTTMGSMTSSYSQPLVAPVVAPVAPAPVVATQPVGFAQGGLTDLNRDGIPDQLQLQQGLQHAPSQRLSGTFLGLTRNPSLSSVQYPERPGLLSQPQIITRGPQNQILQSNLVQQGNLNPGHRTLSDLNGNGIPDRMEKAHGLRDLNGNGIDDSLERRMDQTTLGPNARV